MTKFILFIFILFSSQVYATADQILFNVESLKNWQQKSFAGETNYQISSYQEKTALKAVSNSSASGLVLEKRIDLLATPYLSWSWLIKQNLPAMDEQSKTGDDYAARIYVVIDGGMMPWKTKSLNYVWSSSQQVGAEWNNAFASSNVKMIAVRGKYDKTDAWFSEKRNVYQDLIRFFGDKGSEQANLKAYRYIDAIAIMTDTDNSQSSAESYYGDITFTTN